ncbi:MAG: TonB-dependent receptor [Caulobacteraceae bacterium]
MLARKLLFACTSVSAIALAMPALAAPARDVPAPVTAVSVDEVEITGTNIRGVAGVASPVEQFSREEFIEAGASTPGEITRSMPAVLNLGADESRLSGAQDGAANTTRATAINIRGIGNEATLTLFNGRRLAPNGVIKSLSDINQIPASAIERLEIVTDGASAVYGSDAVAGVVNIITRRNFDGAETTLRYGGGDGIDQYVLSQTWGRTWDTGSIFMAMELNQRSRLNGEDRPFVWQDRTARGGTDARSFSAQPGNILITQAGVSYRYALPAGTGAPGTINTANLLYTNPANRFDETRYADVLPEQQRASFLFNMTQQVDPRLSIWTEGFYTHHTFNERVAPATATVGITAANPYYTAPLLANLPPGVLAVPGTISVEYRFLAEDVTPQLDGYEDSLQAALGFNFDLTDNWRLSGYVDFNHDHGLQVREAILNNNLLTAARARTTLATAFNPFGNGSTNAGGTGPTNNLGSAFTGILAHRDTYATSTLADFNLAISGDVMDVWGGTMKLAAGVENHAATFNQRLVATNTSTDGSPTVKLVRNTREWQSVYGELFIPLIGETNAGPGAQRLELSLAARWDNYSDFGSTVNPKIGIIYAPVDEFVLRATYGTSFRAPSLVDSAGQIHNIFVRNNTIVDPTAPGGVTTGIFHNGGRVGLSPEEATTWSGGFDWQPSFVPGLRLSATYYDVKYTNRIDVVPENALATATAAFYAPYVTRRPDAADVAGNAAFDALVTAFYADPDLQSAPLAVSSIKVIIDGRRANLGVLKQSGLELSADYRFTTETAGDWNFGLSVAKIFSLKRQLVASAPAVDFLDQFNNPVDLRYRATVGWRLGGFSANVFYNYTDGYTNTANATPAAVDSYATVDFSASYRFGEESGALKGVRVTLSGQNVLDEDPPVVLNGSISWDSQNASPIGRFISFEISKSW